ncbi:hypothetical protein NW755_010905 [Fusarium falciforme]|uniref:Uncharacterized protein n=1 Tax=Fusarium falciforme TaxID=195108 RepID=A0A9W8R0J4_9HYPO|nr:hypothetical protein NW755_010905 [Fusarium falciforme]
MSSIESSAVSSTESITVSTTAPTAETTTAESTTVEPFHEGPNSGRVTLTYGDTNYIRQALDADLVKPGVNYNVGA